MGQRGKVIRGKFPYRRGRNHQQQLPSDHLSLLRSSKPTRSLKPYIFLWGGAVAVGLAVGAGPEWARRVSGASSEAEVSAAKSPSTDTGSIFDFGKATPTSGGILAEFSFCHTGSGTNCVVDGDTIWLESQKIRIADIDAPETHDHGCPAEKELGDRATQRLLQLVNGGSVSVSSIERDEDRYGRKLRIVMVDGVGVGDTLVSEGLARYYGNGRKSWC